MARPRKLRQVCDLPLSDQFGPIGICKKDANIISMNVEEYETIRLIDLEGLTQEECAETMHVARTTVQRIYIEARRKLADFLVNASILNIEGGNYKLCKNKDQPEGCGMCRRARGPGRGQGRGMKFEEE